MAKQVTFYSTVKKMPNNFIPKVYYEKDYKRHEINSLAVSK